MALIPLKPICIESYLSIKSREIPMQITTHTAWFITFIHALTLDRPCVAGRMIAGESNCNIPQGCYSMHPRLISTKSTMQTAMFHEADWLRNFTKLKAEWNLYIETIQCDIKR